MSQAQGAAASRGAARLDARLIIGGADTIEIPFDLGLDLGFLGFEVTNGGVDLNLGYSFDVGFRIDKHQGFTLLLNDDPADPEIALNLGVGLQPGTEIKANLFFLTIKATDAGLRSRACSAATPSATHSMSASGNSWRSRSSIKSRKS